MQINILGIIAFLNYLLLQNIVDLVVAFNYWIIFEQFRDWTQKPYFLHSMLSVWPVQRPRKRQRKGNILGKSVIVASKKVNYFLLVLFFLFLFGSLMQLQSVISKILKIAGKYAYLKYHLPIQDSIGMSIWKYFTTKNFLEFPIVLWYKI